MDDKSDNAASSSKPLEASRWPTQDELPYDDGEKMESIRHALQLPLLQVPLNHYWKGRSDFFVGTNMFVYFDPDQEKTKNYKGPDAFVALGVKPRQGRKSYVIWEEEGHVPDVIIEILSDRTVKNDKGSKKLIYQNLLRVPEYFWCDPYRDDFAGFELKNGKYKRIAPNAHGMLPSKRLGLMLTRWKGEYCSEYSDYWLRWATPKGILLPTGDELAAIERRLKTDERKRADVECKRADDERKRADDQCKRAEDERKRADKLAELLKKHGIKPDA